LVNEKTGIEKDPTGFKTQKQGTASITGSGFTKAV
jgi:hypothetical protein